MRTLVISDLHLGAYSRADLLRRAELREPLIAALREERIERLLINGDAVELREVPVRDAARDARELFAAVGKALGEDGEIVITAGNHDHGLLAGWIETRLNQTPAHETGLSHAIAPEQAGPLAVELAEAAAPARMTLAYPGIWLREDVYAFHGHYLDLHTTVPTIERVAAGAMAKWVAPLPTDHATPDDYEACLAPIYAWIHALAQRSQHGLVSAGAGASARAWVALAGEGRRTHPIKAAALGGGYVGLIGALNRAGLGPLRRDLSGAALRQGSLRGMREVIRRLDIRAQHVIFGHSHRSGPWPGDDREEWTAHNGARLMNTGSWVYQRHFLSGEPNQSPYWPGTAVVVEDDGPPRLTRLLGERGHPELRPPPE